MKLYAFKPRGHGEPSFFVCAEDARLARKAIDEYMRDDDCWHDIDDHEVKELEPMAVIDNDND